MEIGISPEPQQPDSEFRSPYCIALYEKAKSRMPENQEGLRLIFQEIDRQSIDNFGTLKPSRFPGAEVSYIRYTIAPELMKTLAKGEPKEIQPLLKNEEAKDEVAFLFSSLGKPPDGNALNSQDLAIDRFFRNLTRVARAIKEGRTPPSVEMYLFGTGTGVGEKATPALLDAVRTEGLNVMGEIYAEFVEQVLAGRDLSKTHILLEGASLGVGAADKTFSNLPKTIRDASQRLFDNPTGGHEPGNKLKGIRIAAGFVPEFAYRKVFDPVARRLDAAKKPSSEFLMTQKGIQPDDQEQINLKNNLFNTATAKVLEGYGLNQDERTFLRRGTKDFTSSGRAVRMRRVQRTGPDGQMREVKAVPMESFAGREGKIIQRDPGQPQSDRGRTLEAPMKRGHSFVRENFGRWNEILNYCKSVPSTA